MSLEFCCVKGCTDLGPAYRATPKDILRYLCDRHAQEHGFVVGQKPAEACYSIPDWMQTNIRRAAKRRSDPVQAVAADGVTVLKDYPSVRAFSQATGIPLHAVYAPLRGRYMCRGQYVRYASDAKNWKPARKPAAGAKGRGMDDETRSMG